MSNSSRHPRVGVAVIIVRHGKVLVGLRKAGNEKGTWAPPGGALEFGEDWLDAGARETREETSLSVRELRLVRVTNDVIAAEDVHWVTLWLEAGEASGEARVASPEEHERWEWRAWDDLPTPQHTSLRNLVKSGWRPGT